MLITTLDQFDDFRLIDTGQGNRLEQWGDYRLIRPDPQTIWQRHAPESEWQKAQATFHSRGDSGAWTKKPDMPESWTVRYRNAILEARLTPFKHTGIFPEQAANWDWMIKCVGGKVSAMNHQKLKILNLFGYTGGATIILTKLGHFVTHVDASKPALGWGKRNQALNNLPTDSIRWIVDDAAKFAAREVKRKQTYNAIMMDPPAFGHSPSGKVWKFNRDLPQLLANCVSILSARPVFFLINAYATNSSPFALQNILEDTFKPRAGTIESGELCLQQTDGRKISTGIVARWSLEQHL